LKITVGSQAKIVDLENQTTSAGKKIVASNSTPRTPFAAVNTLHAH